MNRANRSNSTRPGIIQEFIATVMFEIPVAAPEGKEYPRLNNSLPRSLLLPRNYSKADTAQPARNHRPAAKGNILRRRSNNSLSPFPPSPSKIIRKSSGRGAFEIISLVSRVLFLPSFVPSNPLTCSSRGDARYARAIPGQFPASIGDAHIGEHGGV